MVLLTIKDVHWGDRTILWCSVPIVPTKIRRGIGDGKFLPYSEDELGTNHLNHQGLGHKDQRTYQTSI